MLSENSLTPEEALSMAKPPFVINSLNFFKTANGKKYVATWRTGLLKNERLSNQLSSVLVEEYPLDEEPVYTDVATRPKTIMQFTTYGQKNF